MADKISRYGWKSNGAPGELKYVAKEDLFVNHIYQRKLNKLKRKEIMTNFDWVAFGTLTCAKEPDGKLWVIDGQHRLAAAMSRSDIEKVPCNIFISEGEEHEASAFLASNRNRKPLSGYDTFRAMIASRDPIALEIKDMVEKSGLSVSGNGTDKNEVRCIRTLCNCMTKNKAIMYRVWPIIVLVCNGSPVDNRLATGMHLVEGRLIDEKTGEKRSLTDPKLKNKLLDAGINAIIRSIGDAAAYYHRGGESVYAEGILNILNHGKHNKLGLGPWNPDA